MILSIPFTKLEAAQNDFVLIDHRERFFPAKRMRDFARAVCHRRRGIGADGLIFIEDSEANDFRMLFFNPDGSDGSMCGNGGRCAALYATERSIASRLMQFDVLGSTYRGEILPDTIRLFFPDPGEIRLDLLIDTPTGRIPCHFIHVGAPHVVCFIDEMPAGAGMSLLPEWDIDGIGRMLREHPAFSPAGANANFLEIDREGIVQLRTFEKGVEAETASCGTGTIATALVAVLKRGLVPPVTIKSHGGDLLRVSCRIEEGFPVDIQLEGPARQVFEGRLDFDTETGAIVSASGR